MSTVYHSEPGASGRKEKFLTFFLQTTFATAALTELSFPLRLVVPVTEQVTLDTYATQHADGVRLSYRHDAKVSRHLYA